MLRCQAEIARDLPCNDPIGKLGYVCVVCGTSACNRHSADCERELKCCQNCMRECCGCGEIRPANDGCDESNDFLCSKCVRGLAVLRVELTKLPLAYLPQYLVELGVPEREVAELHLGPLDVADLMPPLVPLIEDSNEVCA